MGISFSGISQNCTDFNTMTSSVADYNNDVLYPIGSTLLMSGDLQIIKTKSGAWGPGYFEQTTINSIAPANLLFHGYLTFDVSGAAYSCRELNINGFAEKVIIGNDTINVATSSFAPYNGSGFVLDTLTGGGLKVTGTFSDVTIWIPTGMLIEACLDSCATQAPNNSGCIDINNTTFTDTPANYNNDVVYPVGSPYLISGDLSIVKTKSSNGPGFEQSFINWVNANEILFHGYLTFDVSASTAACKELTVNVNYPEKIIIGNDTISLIPPFSSYAGNGFVVDTLAGGLKISGNFNEVTFYNQTMMFFAACLDTCSLPTGNGCTDFTNMTAPVADYNNDALYPIGSTLLTSGDIEIIKTKSGAWGPGYFEQTTINWINPTDIGFHGYLTFDVSSATYSCKELTINGFAEKVIIGNDTINVTTSSFAPYNGNGFVLDTLTGGGYKITGSFNGVTIWIPTGILYDVCLESCSPCHTAFTYTVNGNVVTFTNTSSTDAQNADQFMWDFGDGNTSGDTNPIHTYASPGTYWVCLTVVDFSCPSNPTMQYCDSVTIGGGCQGGQFIITPNDDGQADDVFVPSGSKIFDRNGFLVRTVTADVNWKGRNDNNESLPMGYYTIICPDNGVFNVTIVK